MVPGVYIRPDTQEATGSERRTSVDGMDVTDPFGGDVFAVNLNYEAIQDVEIKALGAEASDGASMVGQFMNVVTKSGGNTVHGSFALFMIPQRFNDSNVEGIAPNNRRDIQPDTTLGGPILRDRIWFFGSYRRIQQDQTVNNAPVPRERRGNLYFVKVTGQLRPNHRLAGTYQYDRTTRGERGHSWHSRAGTKLRQPDHRSQQRDDADHESVGIRHAHHRWSFGRRQLQLGDEQHAAVPVRGQLDGQQAVERRTERRRSARADEDHPDQRRRQHRRQPDDDLAGGRVWCDRQGRSLDAVSRAIDDVLFEPLRLARVQRRRRHLPVHPQRHEQRRAAGRVLLQAAGHDRQPGRALRAPHAAQLCRERGATIDNEAYERHAAFYFQDRWKPTSSISIKAGFRLETNSIYTKDREAVLGPRLPANFPTNTADREFHQTVGMPNVGIAWDAGKYGVFRATANRSYEWLDLGGGDGTSHAPYVLTTDVFRANPRTVAPALNETLPGQFALGVAYGDEKDGSIHNGRTYVNEFSAGWEHQLPATSSLGVTFLWRRNWDYQSGDDQNIIRDPVTGALARPAVPRLRRGAQHLQPELHVAAEPVDPVPVHQELRRRLGDQLQLLVHALVARSHALESRRPTRCNSWASVRRTTIPTGPTRVITHGSRRFVRLPWQTMFSVFYSFSQGRRFDVTTGDFPLNATAPRIVLSNGRSIADPFFNPAYPRARKRDVDMLISDARASGQPARCRRRYRCQAR